MSEEFMRQVAHRPWPLPQRPWVWRQRWDSVLLLHFRVPPSRIAPLLPPVLAVDTCRGSAWVSVVPFRMLNVRPRGCPSVGFVSDFAELNLRTYVRKDDRPGVFFLSVDASRRLPAWLGRTLSPLPYRYAPLHWRPHGGGVSVQHPALEVSFAAAAPLQCASAGTLDAFLVERYCLYAATAGKVVRMDVHHAPWPLVEARVRVDRNDLLQGLGVARPRRPDGVHLSPGVEVVGFRGEVVARG